ncbi:SDR family oxidoreductase [Actinoplanes sp. NPDC051851]|uniref:SDR family oxidoreductase n=1 Tax=Actinoplanes sp. NPDC051851 TaxID=3154753 RepID=UPI003425BD43
MLRRNILITGASSGLGLGLAREFAARGRNLALCARRLDRLTALRDDLLTTHPKIKIEVRRLDVTDPDQVREVFGAFRSTLGTLDRVIVNAGVSGGGPIGQVTHEEGNLALLQTNVIGSYLQCSAAMTILRDQNAGHLVLMSSMSAKRGLPGSLATYAASKAAVASLGQSLTADTVGTPITVTTLYPGYIRMEMTDTSRGEIPFIIEADRGTHLLAAAIEREPSTAIVPSWPWKPIAATVRLLPARVIAELS